MAMLLDLPPELIVKILEKLSYDNIDKCRPTCKKFDEVGRHIMRMGMRKLATRSQSVAKNFITKDHTSKKKKTLNMKRLALGVKSLLSLEALIRTADAVSFHLVGSKVLPPFPGVLLDYIHRAVTLATRRNPLIGEDRLKNIFSSLLESLTNGLKSYSSRKPGACLPDEAVFFTLVDLFNSLPLTREKVRQTDYGMQIFYLLPNIPLVFDASLVFDCDQGTLENIKMLMNLVFITAKISQHFIDRNSQVEIRPYEPDRPGGIDFDMLVFQIALCEVKTGFNWRDLKADDSNLLGFRVLLSSTDETDNSKLKIVLSSSRFPHI